MKSRRERITPGTASSGPTLRSSPESPKPAAVVVNLPPKTIAEKITDGVLQASRRKPAQISPYRPPDEFFPPSVLPKATSARAIAQDETIGANYGWANSSANIYREGLAFLGYPYLAELTQRAEYRVISEVIASEMTRKWIEFKGTGTDKSLDDKIKELAEEVKRFRLKEVFYQLAEKDGFFGRAHLFVDVGDSDDRHEMLTSLGNGKDKTSKSKVGKGDLNGFRTVEAMWCYPTRYNSVDPLKPDWYRPQTWLVVGKEIHRTRLLTLVGREVPDLLKPAYAFGGISLSQMAKAYVDNWLRTRQSVADIVRAFSVFLLKTNLGETLSMGGDQLFRRAQLFNNVRDNGNLMMISKDDEDFANVSAPLGGLDHLQAQTQEHMSAVSRIPLVKLLGITPSGLNASSEGEIRVFYDTIHAYQEHLYRDPLTTCIDFIQLNKWGEVDPNITFDFVNLWELDEAAEAAVQQQKSATRDLDIQSGTVSPAEARRSVANDPKSYYAGLDLGDTPPPEPPAAPEEGGGEPSMGLTNREEKGAEGFGSPSTGGFKGDLAMAFDGVVFDDESVFWRAADAAKFEENKHPRDRKGQFSTNVELSDTEKETAHAKLNSLEVHPHPWEEGKENPQPIIKPKDVGFQEDIEKGSGKVVNHIFGIKHEGSAWYKETEVPIENIYRAQPYIPVEGLKAYIDNLNSNSEIPDLALYDGKYYVASGHTRIGAQMLAGRKKIKTKVFKYEDNPRKPWEKIQVRHTGGFKGDLAMAFDDWTEHLHPRDEGGKFAKKGEVGSGFHNVLLSKGFKEHPDSLYAIYTHKSGHQVAFAPPTPANKQSVGWAHYKDWKQANGGKGNKGGTGSGKLAEYLEKQGIGAPTGEENTPKFDLMPAYKNLFQKEGFSFFVASPAGYLYKKDLIFVLVNGINSKGNSTWKIFEDGEEISNGEGKINLEHSIKNMGLPKSIAAPVEPVGSKSESPAGLSGTVKASLEGFAAYAPAPSSSQKSAISTYTAGSYQSINNCLRHQIGCTPQIQKIRDEVAEYLAKASAPEPMILSRKVSGEYAKVLMSILDEGDTFRDHGIISTSVEHGAWSGELKLTIHVPKGAPAAAIWHMSQHPDEKEVLLPPGSRFRVKKFDRASKQIEVDFIGSPTWKDDES